MAQTKQNLGEGSVRRLMFRLALPAVVAQVVNLLYNVVDRIYIGHIPGIGAAALTGVGLFTPILMLLNAAAMLPSAGGAPRAAIAMGRGNNEEAEKIMGNCFTLLLLLTAVLTVSLYTASPALLRWFGASDITLPYALSYARIYVLGSVCVLMVLGMNPFITTQGFTKISMLTTVIGAAINIVLDPIFIFGLGLGVRGAALATVMSQAVGVVWILRFLTGGKTILHLKRQNMKLIPAVFLPCLGLGVSVFVMLSTESLLSISFNSSLARYGGDLAVGAMTILTSSMQLITMILQGLCQGGQPITSFNYGAGKMDRVKQSFYTLFTACVCYSGLCWAAAMSAPRLLAGVFTNDPALIEYTVWAIRIYLACCFTCGFQISCQQTFMALGQAKVSLLLACLRKLVLLIPLIYLLPCFFADKVFAVFLAEPVCDVLAAAVTTIVFLVRFPKILREGAAKS